MKQHRILTLSALFVFLVISGFIHAKDKTPTIKNYLGRWNIRIIKSGDSFPSSWLKIKQVDNQLKGELVWKWGSVTGISDIKVESGELKFTRGQEHFSARLKGNRITGYLQRGKKKKIDFSGRRASEMCEINGTWKVVPADRPDEDPGIIMFKKSGKKITCKITGPDGKEYNIKKVKLDGYKFSFNWKPSEKQDLTIGVKGEIRGDELVGSLELLSPKKEKPKIISFKGKRQREWGKPIALLAKEGLKGWKSRDPKRKLGWKVKNGILENSPPDVDIVSEKKFRDFKLHVEYKVNKGSNSGIYLRGRYELQILGDTAIQPHGNMAVYSRLSPKKNPMKTPLNDKWQSIDVTFIGRWVTVSLNGVVIHDNDYLDGITGGAIDPWESRPGPLLLQGDHGKIQFRNIIITPSK